MNIAFPAFLIFLIILPGFIFHSAYRVTENTNLDYAPFSSATVRGIVTSGFFHWVWIWLANSWCHYTIQYDTFLTLLIGEKDKALEVAISRAVSEPFVIFSYFASIYIAAWLLGYLLRWITVSLHLDKVELLANLIQYKTDWYYLLRPEIEEEYSVIISAVVELSKEAYLYTGILEDYYLDNNGNLDRLILVFAARRPLTADKEQGCEGLPNRFYPIDGDQFVLRYSEVKTLNVKLVMTRVEEGS